ncbi:MAG: DNA helicase RecQ [Chlorobium sp.]|uniref:DNA helicase RecQ n=1 Tax=Chlorobium sp. TaxID=1095 RepID=UPI0025C21121|nr:DNA helicase RecQ [Chlorobium sp.]MCF8216633.1 DNA helicase RecQ [Chlorobium sp.]MCF8271503.1 DNA helicase RecQ [Chlorobium sp.]MCF8287875.1 DNA helicase RecQ [Chlorobium sp.]MCF8291436.1 DNA helicase RecQ [Chlorobium sp.]MCF8385531.1 DNA helicase RecQ [Chlorobium sp.]
MSEKETIPAYDDNILSGTLRRVFGFSGFRRDQERIVRAILESRDIFAVMPTGGGKSLCYQLPAVMLPGTCLVVSPLIALMKDQVDGARANGIRAAFLNSSISPLEQDDVLCQLQSDALDLLYIAPERFALERFRDIAAKARISLAVIDEAHCISEWGHDFRPDYLSLSKLVSLFPKVPVAAFTATATHSVQDDILRRLGLRDPLVVRASFDRTNLFYDIRFKENANEQLVSIIKNNQGKAGIIYRTSRKSVSDTATILRAKGFRALPYHAGLGDDERKRNQEAFIRDEIDVIVATIAFGMGIDKSNIRFVIHADLPKSIENYYQETGRAGRDGEPARCILLFSHGDIPKVRFFIDSIADEAERARALDAFSKVVSFASSSVCRRKSLLEYFGETYPDQNCGNCDVCKGSLKTINCTREAQMLLSAIVRTDERFGASHIIDIVTGSTNRKVLDFGHDRIKTYGAGKSKKKPFWKRLVDELLARKIISRSEGLFPALYLLPDASRVLKNEMEIEMAAAVETKRQKNSAPVSTGQDNGELFELLRALRKEIADEQGVPPYVVFSDRSLRDMALLLPRDNETMLAVSGVGEVKLQRYGRQFISCIMRWCDTNGSLNEERTKNKGGER